MRKRFVGEELQEMVSLYRDGATAEHLAKCYGTIPVTVLRALRREGIPIRRGGQRRGFTAAQTKDIIRRYRAGESQEIIAAALGCSQPRISRTLRAEGVRTGRTHLEGTRHPMWRGGRLSVGGYLYRWLADDHPFASMRHTQGYAAEHRLVMAESLGRPLAPHETVHHINGVKTDNRLENLQLRNGRHGNGHALVCRACGSHDIGEAPLA